MQGKSLGDDEAELLERLNARRGRSVGVAVELVCSGTFPNCCSRGDDATGARSVGDSFVHPCRVLPRPTEGILMLSWSVVKEKVVSEGAPASVWIDGHWNQGNP